MSKRRAHLPKEEKNSEIPAPVAREDQETTTAMVSTEKCVLLREIHHQVKNSLQLISSLLRLQGRTAADAGVIAALRESQNRIDTIALLHEHLHKLDTPAPAKIDVSVYAGKLLSHIVSLSNSTKNLPHLRLNLDPLTLDLESTLHCGLILNELVTNCLRHAFPDDREGTIYVRLRVTGKTVLLTVQDNGVGLPRHFDARSSLSLGTTLVQQLTRQLGGTIVFAAKNGTKVSLRFQLKEKK